MTLAQLYEAQKQYFDAFTLYSILYKTNPNDDVLARKQSIEKKIFTDQSLEYNNIINKIFTAEDKEKFRLLPDTNYQSLQDAMEQAHFEPIVFQDEEFDEPPEEEIEKEEVEDAYFGKKPKIEGVTYVDDLIFDDILTIPLKTNNINIVNPSPTPECLESLHEGIQDTNINSQISNLKSEKELQDTNTKSQITNHKSQISPLLYQAERSSALRWGQNEDADLIEMTLSRFSQYIIDTIGEDKKISELSLKEIKKIKSILQELF